MSTLGTISSYLVVVKCIISFLVKHHVVIHWFHNAGSEHDMSWAILKILSYDLSKYKLL